MLYSKFLRILFQFTLFISLIGFVFSANPQLHFSQTNYPSGKVDFIGTASSGSQVYLEINGVQFSTKKDIIAPGKVVNLSGDIQNYNMILGSSIEFKNIDPSRDYGLSFDDGVTPTPIYHLISPGESYIYHSPENPGSIILRDEETSQQKSITISDTQIEFNFSDVHTALLDGDNEVLFRVTINDDSNEFKYNVNYDKFSVDISVDDYKKNTADNKIQVSGSISDSNSNLIYVVNNDGLLTNLGGLSKITINNGKFNQTITDLSEGENSIRLISFDPENKRIINGETKINVSVDSILPTFNIVNITYSENNKDKVVNQEENNMYLNSNHLIFSIKTDGNKFIATINGKNETEIIENGSIEYVLKNLKQGQNNLTFYVFDLAGNQFKLGKNIYYDPSPLNLEEFDPKNGDTVHFQLQQFSGKVNKPNAKIIVFTLPKRTYYIEDEFSNKKPTTASCDDFKFLGVRSLGQLDSDRVDSVENNIVETQASLMSLIGPGRVTTTSDSNGNFRTNPVVLHSDSFDSGDLNQAENDNPKVSSVKSPNTVCIIMSDKFGNTKTAQKSITLDSGNTLWTKGEVTTIPNSVYSSEIEMQSAKGSESANFGVIARFIYSGSGHVTRISGLSIRKDPSYSKESKQVSVQSNPTYIYKDGELIVYMNLKLNPSGKDPLKYDDKIDIGLQAIFTYDVEGSQIPIDTINPVYFQTQINIEKPLDHTKWLSPENLNSMIGFFNKTLKYTKQAADYMKYATVGGALYCTFAEFKHMQEITEAKTKEKPEERKKAIENADRKLYQVCDRVACTPSPPECNVVGADKKTGMVDVSNFNYDSSSKSKTYSGDDFNDQFNFEGKGAWDKMKLYGGCKYSSGNHESCTVGTENCDGVFVSGEVKIYKQDQGALGTVREISHNSDITKTCVPAKWDKKTKKLKEVNVNQVGGICWTKESPRYDDTRCNFFNSNNPIKGKDSSVSLFSSIQCGCITDTYSHLNVMSRVQEGIIKCLKQAKIGVVKGSYCERLLGQAVCDIATNVVIPELKQSAKSSGSGSETHKEGGTSFFDFLKNKEETEAGFNSRYAGTIMTKTGFSTQSIMNKACLGAITGDWSILEDSMLTAIDQNEVAPTFGPPFAESRLEGYNPFTGKLQIRYTYTYAVVSGGQNIQTKVEFLCDGTGNAPYDKFCPKNQIISGNDVVNSYLSNKNLVVTKGDSKSETIITLDKHALFWYNKIRFTHTYQLKGEIKNETKDFAILHKEENLPANCHWNAGAFGTELVSEAAKTANQIANPDETIVCDSIFGKNALLTSLQIDKKDSKIVPQTTFYPGNSIFFKMKYSTTGVSDGEDIALAYIAVCKNGDTSTYLKGSGESRNGVNVIPLDSSQITPIGMITKKLFEVTNVVNSNNPDYIASIENNDLKNYDCIGFTNQNGFQGASFTIKKSEPENIFNGDESYGFVTQNLNVAGSDAKYTYKKLDKSKDLTSVKLYFDKSIDNKVSVMAFKLKSGETDCKLKNIDDTSTPLSFKIHSDVDTLTSGSCTLYARLLPRDVAVGLTSTNFESYSPIADNNEDEKLISNMENIQNVFKTTFSLREKSPDADKLHVQLVSPVEKGVIFVDKTGTTNNALYFIAQNGNNDNVDPEITYKISSNRFGTLAEINDFVNFEPESNDGFYRRPFGQLKITKSLKTVLEESSSNKFSQWAIGGSSGAQATIDYTIKIGDVKKKDSQNVYIVGIGDEFEVTSIGTTPNTGTESIGDSGTTEEVK